MHSPTLLTALALLVPLTLSQSTSVTQAQLTQVDNAYAALGFANESLTGFGLPLQSTGLLSVTYTPGPGLIVNGNSYTVGDVSLQPTVAFAPLTPAAAGAEYALTLADAASLTIPDPQGNFRHYLAANIVAGADGTLALNTSDVLTGYAAPGPLPGSGVHRYAWLLFSQPANFPTIAGSSGLGLEGPAHWNVSSFVTGQGNGLVLIASSFFQVAATGSNTTTSATQSSSAASSTSSSSSSASATSAAASASSTSSTAAKSAAGRGFVAPSFAVAGVGMVGLWAGL